MSKRFIMVMIIFLILVLTGCREKGDSLSYEKMMQSEKFYTTSDNREMFDSLQEFLEKNHSRGVLEALVCGDVVETKHFIEWDAEYKHIAGYAINSILIQKICDPYSSVEIMAGDVIPVFQPYEVQFKYEEDFFTYISQQTGEKISCWDDMMSLGNCVFEMNLYDNNEYRIMLEDNLLPLQQMQSYTFVLRLYKEEFVNNEQLYGCEYALPFGDMETLNSLCEKYNLFFSDDYQIIAEEVVAALKSIE